MYQQYGDPQIIIDSYSSMKAWSDFLWDTNRMDISGTNPTYLRIANNGGPAGTREWVLGDWLAYPEDLPSDYRRLTNTIFAAYSNSLFAKMAQAVGDPYGEAATYQTRSDSIVGGIKRQYLQSGRLIHTGGSTQEKQTAYAMMLYFGLDKENHAQYAQRLSELIMANGGRLSTGFAGVGCLNPALSNNGYTATAYVLLEQENMPSWLFCVGQGATTAWERWNSYTSSGFGSAGMNSFNHYAFGSVGEWLMSGVLGIQRDQSGPGTTGFRHFKLNPQHGGTVTYAKGFYDSMSGRIVSGWSLNNRTGAFTYNCSVPANTSATVYLPVDSLAGAANVTEGGLPLAGAKGVAIGAYDSVNKRLAIEVVSGSYSFGSSIGIPARN
jgi:alpha-L-rhamnosidase